ncbi:MAG: YfcE family phosphodiesterase [Lentisphaerae bacterium]|nr:MAG: YfcE family phosphodiesterase [Lentisphaerota bacterium]
MPSPNLRILILSDCHGQHSPHMSREKIDLALIAGDITDFGNEQAAERVLQPLRMEKIPVFAISGNCDLPQVQTYLERENMSLHCRIVPFQNVLLCGIAYSLPCPGTTPGEISETEFNNFLRELKSRFQTHEQDKPLIFLSHQPPFDTLADRLHSGRHVGSRAIRWFIGQATPLLAVCGHIHEARTVQRLDGTVLVNPGPWARGYYAIASIYDDSVDVQLCPRCE